ncbi:TraB/GumN family protein [Parerythrobacter aurantius]|uniref:TraB/GumN family protein n=1 Tax=Parerythrobacter aurantius TaxID=3127706 RepID=UPI003247FB33
MIAHRLQAALAAMLLAACSGDPAPPPAPTADNPLLWEIAGADGRVEGWLFGTIHALPDGTEWHSGAVAEVTGKADYLVLEVAALDDSDAIRRSFMALAQSPGQPPLALRLDPGRRQALGDLIASTSYDADDFETIETWGAALIMAQAIASDAKPANGVDRALQRHFAGRRIEEFEGASAQFAIFDRLAEEDQRAMLAAVVDEAGLSKGRRSPAQIWLAGDLAALERETTSGILADPEVREALLVERNAAWVQRTVNLLRAGEQPLIAVGAAHLPGSDGMIALLAAEGYTLRRIGQGP